jgi:hypothetical protein
MKSVLGKNWLQAHGGLWIPWVLPLMYIVLAWTPEKALSNPLGPSRQTISGALVVISVGACLVVAMLDDKVRPRVVHPDLLRYKRLAWVVLAIAAYSLSAWPFWSSLGISQLSLVLFMLLAVPLMLTCFIGLPTAWLWQLLYFLSHLLLGLDGPSPWWALAPQHQNTDFVSAILLAGTVLSVTIYVERGPREWSIAAGRDRTY